MENENNISKNQNVENDDSLDRSVQVEQILEFYKDNKSDENNPEITEIKIDKFENIRKLFVKLNTNIVNLLNKIPFINIEIDNDDNPEIETHNFGLSENGKKTLYRIASAVISVLIVVFSIILAIYLPGNEEIITAKEEELRTSEDYVDIKSRYSSLKTEVEELEASNEIKKGLITEIDDVDNTKSTLRTQINDKKYELDALNQQIESKKQTIAELDKSIAAKTPPETVYSPGKYTVGTHIAAGKYYVTGTGKFMVASAGGVSKVNVSLGSTPIEINLEANDKVQFDSKVKFTSAY